MTNKILSLVTERIIERSKKTRAAYLERVKTAQSSGPVRTHLDCGNIAHGFAGCSKQEKDNLKNTNKPNIGIISAYNDMLSAHQPYHNFPEIIKKAALENGAVAQFASGVPAMCDGVTQGQDGMELSLFSRDVIALATSVGLSHNMFDGAMLLGICDKIVPGLLIGSLSFAHLPVVFVPSGPMPSGLPNKEKLYIRELYAAGKIDKKELLEAEIKSYHSPGTCTFYGTANSNQILLEVMGLQLPGGTFVNPYTPLRDALTIEATKILAANMIRKSSRMYEVINEKSIINAIVALLSTGGSTNHTIHLIAIARAAGIIINWDDFSELSSVVPLIARIYPNGELDVNDFRDAGGVGFLIKELLSENLLHEDVTTILGKGLKGFLLEPELKNNQLTWKKSSDKSLNEEVLQPAKSAFRKDGGVKVLSGNIGRAVIKTSTLSEDKMIVEAPALVFETQQQFLDAFKAGNLNRDFIAVVKYQGPHANGMPELHKLTPTLGVLQNLGYKVGLLTDGRMSGAAAKIPAAIHITPESIRNGNIAKIKDGDIILLDALNNKLELKISDEELAARKITHPDISHNNYGTGRELFTNMRKIVTSAEEGASFIL